MIHSSNKAKKIDLTLKLISLSCIVSFIICNLVSPVKAVTITTNTSNHYSDPLPGYDSNYSFYIEQTSNVKFTGYTTGSWPSGVTITYTPCLNDYTVAAVSCFFSAPGTSATIYYTQPYGYKANYRLAAKTSNGSVTTTANYYI